MQDDDEGVLMMAVSHFTGSFTQEVRQTPCHQNPEYEVRNLQEHALNPLELRKIICC